MTASPGAPEAIEGEANSFLAFDLDDLGNVDENLDRPIADSVQRSSDGSLDFCDILGVEWLNLIHIVGLPNRKNH